MWPASILILSHLILRLLVGKLEFGIIGANWSGLRLTSFLAGRCDHMHDYHFWYFYWMIAVGGYSYLNFSINAPLQ
jgi:hypothetical protein